MDRIVNKVLRGPKIIGLIFIMLLLGCTNENEFNEVEPNEFESYEIEFVEEGPFVKLELYLASSGTYLDHFPKIITISNDGNVQVFTKEMVSANGRIEMEVGDNPPTIEKKISSKQVEEIKQVIEKNRFFSIPKDVTDYDVMDGDGSRITVYEKEEKRTVRGENSSHQEYNEIEEVIFNQVEDEYDDWVKETEDYLFELNE